MYIAPTDLATAGLDDSRNGAGRDGGMGSGRPIPGTIDDVRRSTAMDAYGNYPAPDAGSGTKRRRGKGAQPREISASARPLGPLGRFSQGLDLFL